MAELGAEVTVKRNDQITLEEIAQLKPDRIMISPGPGYPRDAGISCDVIREFAGKVPIAGVCLGGFLGLSKMLRQKCNVSEV